MGGGVLRWAWLSVCRSVHMSVRELVSEITRQDITKFLMCVVCGRGSVLLWRRCDTLFISGFADDVMFARNGRESVTRKWSNLRDTRQGQQLMCPIAWFPRVLFIDRLMVQPVQLCRPSVLWRCWLGGRKGIRPVKIERWGAGVVICLEWGAHLHMAQLMPLPLTVSCFNKIQIGFTFLVPAHLGSPGQWAVKRLCVCCVCSAVMVVMSRCISD